jgi:hypothetical protein
MYVAFVDYQHLGRLGSYDAERRVFEPYFRPCLGRGRLGFGVAACQYGLMRLQLRFPKVSETTLKEMLSSPLDLFADTLKRISPQSA